MFYYIFENNNEKSIFLYIFQQKLLANIHTGGTFTEIDLKRGYLFKNIFKKNPYWRPKIKTCLNVLIFKFLNNRVIIIVIGCNVIRTQNRSRRDYGCC